MKVVSLLSGGLDSVTLAYWLRAEYSDRSNADDTIIEGPEQSFELTCLSFDYGQRHRKELAVAADIAKKLGATHHFIGLRERGDEATESRPISSILSGSSLTDDSIAVPDGHYAEESMKQTVVPNRNAIMLSIAYGVAVAQGASVVGFAAHSGDHAIYPDCRPDFVVALNDALRLGNKWANPLPIITGPFLDVSKAEIVKIGARLEVPFAETWSCYKGGSIHCGTCGTCYERREAFKLAGVDDSTKYVDSTTEYAAPV